jgi:hypothetical protein
LVVWAAPVTGAAAAIWASIAPLVEGVQAHGAVARPARSSPVRYAADSFSQATISRDLFRAGRRPASVAYDPARSDQAVVAEVPPKPGLMLVGIVAGLEPTAVIEGFPGIEGARVTRVGDVVAGLRVQRIDATGVRVLGMDTVWLLKVREPWR